MPLDDCQPFSFSAKCGLVYHFTAKSASSTLRQVMNQHFDGMEYKLCGNNSRTSPIHQPLVNHFTFDRDPVSRFLSAFGEVMFREMRKRARPGFNVWRMVSWSMGSKQACCNAIRVWPTPAMESRPLSRDSNNLWPTKMLQICLISIFTIKCQPMWSNHNVPAHFAFRVEDVIFPQIETCLVCQNVRTTTPPSLSFSTLDSRPCSSKPTGTRGHQH
jgi:hypothetical protein